MQVRQLTFGRLMNPYFVGALFMSLSSSAFLNSPLISDEWWMVFDEHYRVYSEPLSGLSGLIQYSIWETEVGRLRLAYPFTQSIGSVISVGLEQVTGANPVFAYGIWRIMANVLVVLSAIWMIGKFVFPFGPEVSLVVKYVTALLLPSLMIANTSLSAFRAFPSHYSLLSAATFMLCGIAFALNNLYRLSNSKNKRTVITISFLFLGVLCATGSEYFYISAVVICFGLGLQYLNVFDSSKVNSNKRTFSPWPLLAFMASFTLTFLVVRLMLLKCQEFESCYSRTEISIPSPRTTFLIAVGQIPPIPLLNSNFTMMSGAFRENTLTLGALVLVYFFVSVLVVSNIRILLTSPTNESRKLSYEQGSICTSFLGISFLITTGFLVSSTVASRFRDTQLGLGGYETILLTMGTALLGVWLFVILILGTKERISITTRVNSSAFLSLIPVLLASIGYLVNVGMTVELRNQPVFKIQRELAIRVNTPPSKLNMNDRRCLALTNKLNKYPDWRGLDEALIRGLNQRYKDKFDINFCATPAESFFLERD
jgi:hypothetical protein